MAVTISLNYDVLLSFAIGDIGYSISSVNDQGRTFRMGTRGAGFPELVDTVTVPADLALNTRTRIRSMASGTPPSLSNPLNLYFGTVAALPTGVGTVYYHTAANIRAMFTASGDEWTEGDAPPAAVQRGQFGFSYEPETTQRGQFGFAYELRAVERGQFGFGYEPAPVVDVERGQFGFGYEPETVVPDVERGQFGFGYEPKPVAPDVERGQFGFGVPGLRLETLQWKTEQIGPAALKITWNPRHPIFGDHSNYSQLIFTTQHPHNPGQGSTGRTYTVDITVGEVVVFGGGRENVSRLTSVTVRSPHVGGGQPGADLVYRFPSEDIILIAWARSQFGFHYSSGAHLERGQFGFGFEYVEPPRAQFGFAYPAADLSSVNFTFEQTAPRAGVIHWNLDAPVFTRNPNYDNFTIVRSGGPGRSESVSVPVVAGSVELPFLLAAPASTTTLFQLRDSSQFSGFVDTREVSVTAGAWARAQFGLGYPHSVLEPRGHFGFGYPAVPVAPRGQFGFGYVNVDSVPRGQFGFGYGSVAEEPGGSPVTPIDTPMSADSDPGFPRPSFWAFMSGKWRNLSGLGCHSTVAARLAALP